MADIAAIRMGDIVNRVVPPAPWDEGDNIPWDDPGFSRRMLAVHLSQDSDSASRRTAIIGRHVNWINAVLLNGEPSKILDLACGPGLYASRLAELGHECVGVDYSPAAIEYAREQASAAGLSIDYRLGDIRAADYDAGYDLVMFIFGELNVFPKCDAAKIIKDSHAALQGEGLLLLEVQTCDSVKARGNVPCSWSASGGGLFSERPYIELKENFWDEVKKVTTTRYYIIDAETGAVSRMAQSARAYTTDEYAALLNESGFSSVEFYPFLGGVRDECAGHLVTIVARKT